jgi:phytoene/squalene synthetase
MDLYTRTAADLAKQLTERYSSSFSSASTLFDKSIRADIYNVYGLVRVADEIVDTYNGKDRAQLLAELETQTYQAMERAFSSNPIVHAFATTAQQYGIERDLIEPFFTSMRMDLTPQNYDTDLLHTYIYGSAEVVGLMCLRVFTQGNTKQYDALKLGAQRLGAAYQKVNFLRDIADDFNNLHRYYFVGSSFATLDDIAKQQITDDIAADFAAAKPYVTALPQSARRAVSLSFAYYQALLRTLEQTPVERIKQQRMSVTKSVKLKLLFQARAGILS